ncbi:hypothetical protein ACWENA_03690 [Streptomyces sp. NPDC004779]
MNSTPEPELPDPVPTAPDAVTPDLPPPDPEAPDIRVAEGGHSPSEKTGGADASDEGRTDDDADGNADARGEGSPTAGPGTPAPQEETD